MLILSFRRFKNFMIKDIVFCVEIILKFSLFYEIYCVMTSVSLVQFFFPENIEKLFLSLSIN